MIGGRFLSYGGRIHPGVIAAGILELEQAEPGLFVLLVRFEQIFGRFKQLLVHFEQVFGCFEQLLVHFEQIFVRFEHPFARRELADDEGRAPA